MYVSTCIRPSQNHSLSIKHWRHPIYYHSTNDVSSHLSLSCYYGATQRAYGGLNSNLPPSNLYLYAMKRGFFPTGSRKRLIFNIIVTIAINYHPIIPHIYSAVSVVRHFSLLFSYLQWPFVSQTDRPPARPPVFARSFQRSLGRGQSLIACDTHAYLQTDSFPVPFPVSVHIIFCGIFVTSSLLPCDIFILLVTINVSEHHPDTDFSLQPHLPRCVNTYAV